MEKRSKIQYFGTFFFIFRLFLHICANINSMEAQHESDSEKKIGTGEETVFPADIVAKTALEAFGIAYLYPWQRLVIANILDAVQSSEDSDGEERGKQIVLLPTGAGKSLCFMVPALIIPGCTLIIYPLLALMADQERRMISGGITPVVFRGQQSEEERNGLFAKISGGARFILANPEVLQSGELLERLKTCAISHIAIDEAHCVSEWGDSFRAAYLELGRVIETLGVKTITAFTATASPSVLERVSKILFSGDARLVRSDSDRQNIHYSVRHTRIKEKELIRCVSEYQKPLIVFCSTRRRAENAARLLRNFLCGDLVRFYHAGLSREEKTAVEQWFFCKTDAVLTATCAYGMGVDKKDIRTVIHFDPPQTAEAYIQEAGRGGRDGSTAQAVLLWSPQDKERALQFAQGSRQRVLYDFAEKGTCRRQILLDALGGEQAVCSGCDICGGTALAEDPVDKKILLFAKKNRRRYQKTEFCRELEKFLNKNTPSQDWQKRWSADETRNLVSQLCKETKLSECRRFFRRQYIDMPKTGE